MFVVRGPPPLYLPLPWFGGRLVSGKSLWSRSTSLLVRSLLPGLHRRQVGEGRVDKPHLVVFHTTKVSDFQKISVGHPTGIQAAQIFFSIGTIRHASGSQTLPHLWPRNTRKQLRVSLPQCILIHCYADFSKNFDRHKATIVSLIIFF